MDKARESEGVRLLSVVERLVDDADDLMVRVDYLKEQAGCAPGEIRTPKTMAVAKRIIAGYSNKSAISGAVTAIPSVLPGAGTLIAAVGGAFIDIGLMLKYEVEMVLSLDYLHGYDIKNTEERRLAFLLASVGVHDVQAGQNFFADVAEAEIEAMWNYTPKQVTKLLVSVMTKLALRSLERHFLAFIPIIGVVICGSMNKIFVSEAGHRCDAVLRQRRRLELPQHAQDNAVDAKIRLAHES